MDEYSISIEIREEEFKKPETVNDLEALFEYNTENMYIDGRHVVFSVDGNTQVRNERYAPYFKMFPDCTVSLKSIPKKQTIYRIFFKKAVFTDHKGVGTTPPSMNASDIALLITALRTIVDSKLVKNCKRYLWEELKFAANSVMQSDLPAFELPVLEIKDEWTKEQKKKAEEEYKKKLKADKERVYAETAMYLNIVHD